MLVRGERNLVVECTEESCQCVQMRFTKEHQFQNISFSLHQRQRSAVCVWRPKPFSKDPLDFGPALSRNELALLGVSKLLYGPIPKVVKGNPS
mmetsp:Transcript_69809/g.131367  ORF Transcript_69809/g.131367 Transcript_69809/m.131367 type:complete len:93 (+) Transcript_69809:255-533(+)